MAPGETSEGPGEQDRAGKTPSKGDVPASACSLREFWGINDMADFVQPVGKAFLVLLIVCRVGDTDPRYFGVSVHQWQGYRCWRLEKRHAEWRGVRRSSERNPGTAASSAHCR